MINLVGLSLTLLSGLFILLGAIIVFSSKNSNKFIHFSISIALGVMLSLVVFELIPEVLHIFSNHYAWFIAIIIVIVLIALGLFLLKILDQFVPEHGNHCEGDCEDDEDCSFYHIGIVATISLLIHQVIEGMAIFGSALSSISLGFLLVLGIGLHSIPLGMVVTSTIYKSTKSIKKTMVYVLSLTLTPLLGGLIMLINGKLLDNELVLGGLLSLTAGMLLYIALFEFLPHLQHTDNKKQTIFGVIIGVLIMLVSVML